jgi:hypothetical protein
MLLKLIRRDHAIHYGPLWLPLAIPVGVIVAAFGKDGITPRIDGDYIGPIVLNWLLVSMMLGFAQVGLRTDRFKLALPLPTRSIWLARLVSIFVFVCAIMAASVAIMVAVNNREGQPLIHGDAIAFVISLFGVMLLAVALVQSYRPSLCEFPVRRGTIAYLVVVWAACLVLLFSLVALGPGWTLVPVALAAVLLVRTWRSLPESFVSQGRGHDAVERGGPTRSPLETSTTAALREASFVATARGATGRRGLLTRTILQSLYSPSAIAVIVGAIVAFLGFYVSGFYPEPLSGPVYMFWIIGIAPAFIVWPATRMFKLDHLPVSRRRVFPYLALPALALLWLGLIGGTVLGNTFAPRAPLREYLRTRDCPFYHRVPDRFLRVAWNGRPPEIVAPWGETRQPWTCRPFAGRRALLYSPYSIPAGSSREFVAWQVSREIAAVYGAQVSPEDIVARFDRYFETGEDGSYRLIAWGDPFRADYPNLKLYDWVRPMVAIALILGVVWFIVTAWIIRAFFIGMSPSFFSMLLRVLPAVFPLVFVAVMVWLGEYGYTTSWKLTALANAMIRRIADLLPSGPAGLWGVFFAVLALFYLIAERMFVRAQSSFERTEK